MSAIQTFIHVTKICNLMNLVQFRKILWLAGYCIFTLLLIAAPASADQVDQTSKYAWFENGGWVNLRPSSAEVEIFPDHLEGYAWAENIGWISLGSYSAGSSHSYTNTSNSDWGVNRDAQGDLSGYAWSENVGWINFNSTHDKVNIDSVTGKFSGHAWSENMGWISFPNVYLAGFCAFYVLPTKNGKSVVICL